MAVVISLFAGAGAQFFDSNGDPLSGGLIYTYAAGTTTPRVTYTSSTGLVPHTNPIVLDAAGRVNEIWLDSALLYKFVLKTSTGITVGTYDNVYGAATTFSPTVDGDLTVNGNAYISLRVGIGTTTPAVKLDINSTDAVRVPVGTTAERPTGATGYLRFNSSQGSFEGFNGTAWGSIGGGATGGGTDQMFYLNGQTVNTSYSIPAGQNAGTFGPITVASGATVTVPTGSTWTVT
jgi:hypothetical protein